MRAPNYTHRTLSLQDGQTARMLYREGWSTADLGRHFGVSRQAIWRMLHKHGVKLRGRHEQRTNDVTRRKRDEAGIIVTLRCQRDGHTITLHVPGKRLDALRYIAKAIDRSQGDWCVLCYSTPETVLGDLQGMRDNNEPPEVNALAAIERLDLLDPKVRQP